MNAVRGALGDVLSAATLGAASAALCGVMRLHRIFGNDGAMLVDWTADPASAFEHYHNTLYLPAARSIAALGLDRAWGGHSDPLAVAQALSAWSAGLLTAAAFAIARTLGASRRGAIFGALLLALSPVCWFFGAAVEVHTSHAAIVATTAFVALWLPWQRRVMATIALAMLFVVPCLSHQAAPALGPGFACLAAAAARRRDCSWSLRHTIGAAAALGGSVLLGHMLVQWRRGQGFAPDMVGLATTIQGWHRPFAPDFLLDEVLLPLGLLLPVFALALASRQLPWRLRVAGAALVVPLLAGMVWWGVRERGGYLLGPAFAFAPLAAAWLDQRQPARRNALAAALLLAQGALGFATVRAFDAEGFDLRARAARIATVCGESGRVVSCNDNAPRVTHWLPKVAEIDMLGTLANDVPLDVWVVPAQNELRRLLTAGPLVFERSYTRRTDLPPRIATAMAMLEQWLQREFVVTPDDDASWPLWVITRR